MTIFNKVQDSRNNIECQSYLFICPGCDQAHHIFTTTGTKLSNNKTPLWKFNGDVNKPTCTPSLSIKFTQGLELEGTLKHCVCHSFIREGQIQYLNDCTHKLAGQTVAIPDWEKYWSKIDED